MPQNEASRVVPDALTTGLLARFGGGDRAADAALAPVIFRELRRVAGGQLRRERPNHTLQATALVNEVWLRLAGDTPVAWQNRAHFLAVSSTMMRQILVDYARRRKAAKRGGGKQITLQDHLASESPDRFVDVLALDQALEKLKLLDERASRVVEMHFFGGLKFEEIAAVLGVAPKTIQRDWRFAKAWLQAELSAGV